METSGLFIVLCFSKCQGQEDDISLVGSVRCGNYTSKEFGLYLSKLENNYSIERPNGFRVEFLCHSADNAIKDRMMQGLRDLNMKYGEERIFGDINGIFTEFIINSNDEIILEATIQLQDWFTYTLQGIFQAISLEDFKVSIEGSGNSYLIDLSVQFSKLLFELLSEHMTINDETLQWLNSLYSQSLNLDVDSPAQLFKNPAVRNFIYQFISSPIVFQSLMEGAEISHIIREAHNDFRISNERVYRFIQFLSTLKEIRKVELSFGGDYVFEILVDYKGLLSLFDTKGRDFGPSYDVNEIIEKSKLFTMHQPFGDEVNISIKDDIHNYVDILNDEVRLGIEIKSEVKEEIKVSPLEEFYIGPVFDLTLSQLFEITGNKVPQFWTRIFTILNKPMNLVEEGVLRVPGNHETINYLQNLIDTGKYELFSTIKITCEDAASLLKLYIRKLPVPIISREIDVKFTTEIIAGDGDIDVLTATQITQIKELLDSLDTAHYCFLFLLSEYLSNVKKQSAKNLMNIMNIKRVLAPTLVSGTAFLEICILHFDNLFDNLERTKVLKRENCISKLDDYCKKRVLMYLQIDDICDIGCVNKEWEIFLNDCVLWKSISDHRGYSLSEEVGDWKEHCTNIYSKSEFRLKGFKMDNGDTFISICSHYNRFHPMSRDNYQRVKVHDSKYEITIIGDQSVGKSNLVSQFINRQFREQYEPTIKDVSQVAFVNINGSRVSVNITDSPSQNKIEDVKTHCYIMTYSCTNEVSFKSLMSQYQLLKNEKMKSNKKVSFVVVGTHCDKYSEIQVSRKEGKLFARRENVPFFEVSGINWNHLVDEIFITSVKEHCFYFSSETSSQQNIIGETQKTQHIPEIQQEQPQEEESSCSIQ